MKLGRHRMMIVRRTLVILAIMAIIVWVGVRNSPDSIYNPDNQPYVLECAADLGIDAKDVTQLQFNERYLK